MNRELITIMGYTFEVENVPYEALKPMPPVPIKELECCCCGRETLGRQWWNMDTGFGLCVKCADRFSKSEHAHDMKKSHGNLGFHYATSECKLREKE